MNCFVSQVKKMLVGVFLLKLIWVSAFVFLHGYQHSHIHFEDQHIHVSFFQIHSGDSENLDAHIHPEHQSEYAHEFCNLIYDFLRVSLNQDERFALKYQVQPQIQLGQFNPLWADRSQLYLAFPKTSPPNLS